MPEVEIPLFVPGAKIKFTKDEVEKIWKELGQIFKSRRKAKSENEADTMPPDIRRSRFVFIRHRVSNWTKGDDSDRELRLVKIWLSSFYENYRENIKKVVWYLPDGFKYPVRERTSHDEKYMINTAAYGDFTVSAEVFFKNGEKSIKVNRVINIDTSLDYNDVPLE